jgi:hypothetical protein
LTSGLPWRIYEYTSRKERTIAVMAGKGNSLPVYSHMISDGIENHAKKICWKKTERMKARGLER